MYKCNYDKRNLLFFVHRPSNQDLMDETMSTPHTKMQKIPPADRYYDPQLVHEVLKLPAVLTRYVDFI